MNNSVKSGKKLVIYCGELPRCRCFAASPKKTKKDPLCIWKSFWEMWYEIASIRSQ